MWKVTEVKRQQNIVHLELEQEGKGYSFTFANTGKTVVVVRHIDQNGISHVNTIRNAENIIILKGGVYSHKGLRLQAASDLPEQVIKYLTNYGEYL
jgi:hypothetical protein